MRGYVQTKARLFIRLGAERYRRGDFFSQPDESLDADQIAALTCAMERLADGRGFSADEPLVGMGAQTLARVAATLHFVGVCKIERQGVVEVTLAHKVSGGQVAVFIAPMAGNPRTTASDRPPSSPSRPW